MACEIPPIASPLNSSQIQFLEDNFVIYDHETGETYSDFSQIHKYQLILVGERHHTEVLHRLHALFLKTITRSTPACLLVESLPPGQSSNPRRIPGWEDLPEQWTMQGSDVRYRWCAEDFLKWQCLERQEVRLNSEYQKFVKENVHQIASLVNESYIAGEAIVNPKRKMLHVGDRVAQRMLHAEEEVKKKDIIRVDELNAISKQMAALSSISYAPAQKGSMETIRSNEGLSKTAIAACQTFSLVVGFWGKNHLVFNDELYQELERAKIHAVILLPNERNYAEAKAETDWRKPNELNTFGLPISSGKDTLTYLIPEVFKSYFHPALRSIFRDSIHKKIEPTLVNVFAFDDLVKRSSVLKFVPGITYQFEGISSEDFNQLSDLVDIDSENGELNKEKDALLKTYLASAINNILLLGMLRASKFQFDGKFKSWVSERDKKPAIELSSDKPFMMELSNDMPMGSMRHLLREMKRLNFNEFRIQPGRRVIFFDISLEEREQLLQNPSQYFNTWLSSRMPKNSVIDYSGEFCFISASITFETGLKEGICLKTNTGCTIRLH